MSNLFERLNNQPNESDNNLEEKNNKINNKNGDSSIKENDIKKENNTINKKSNEKFIENDKKDGNKIINKMENKNVNKKDNEKDNKKEIKTTRFVESLLNQKKEEKVLVGFRLDKSVSDTINQIVKDNKLKKGDFVNDILRKALGL